MNNKVIYKISISVIAVLLIVALAMTLSSFVSMQNPAEKAQAEENLMYAQYNGTNGQITDASAVDGHYSRAQIAAQVGLEDPTKLLAITDGQMLYNYLNNLAYTDVQYAYLANDVAIAYSNITKSGYHTVANHSTNGTFTKYLEGNGYKLSLEVGAGDGVFAEGDKTGDNGGRHGENGGRHIYTGYMTAINQGTIKNLTVDFTSNHIIISSATSNNVALFVGDRNSVAGAGIIAGLNKGTIDNVRVNINNVFSVYKRPGSDRKLYQNTIYVGGIAGVMTAGIISNSQVNIDGNAGVSAFAEGKKTTLIDAWGTGTAAGGILGKIQKGDSKVRYCAVTGSGTINATSNSSMEPEQKWAYAGGAIATSANINDDVTFDQTTVNEGQIQGIISSWTGNRDDNYHQNKKSVRGLLFDMVGSSVQSCAVLYDLPKLTQQGGTAYTTLDSGGQIENWTAIFPTSDGGSMSVRYDTSAALYDLRIEAVADGHDEEKELISEHDMSGTAVPYYKYFLQEGKTGRVIWSGVFDKNGSQTNHIDMSLDKPIYAEIYMLKASDYGTFNYTFGTMGELEYSDNGNAVNGKFVKEYTGQSGVLKLPNVTFKGITQPQGEYTWEVLRNGVATSIEESYMPGTYNMHTAVKMGTNTYGYFNDSERIIAWQPKVDYTFTITEGDLTFGAGTTNSTDWLNEYKFVLEMPQANDFDLLRYQQNGIFASEEIQLQDNERSATVVTTQGTGKNGMQYTFYAYKYDAMLDDYVVVAVSETRTAKIDNEAPEIYDVEYFLENSEGVRTPIAQSALNIWQKEKVVITYMVSDNGKSGIYTAQDISGVTNNELQGEDYKVTIELNDNTPYTLEYIDRAGNKATFDAQAKVDIVSGSLNASIRSYTPYSDVSGRYDYDGFIINLTSAIGNSGWTLYMSEGTDSNGEDIWYEYGKVVNGQKSYNIVKNLGDLNTGAQTTLKMKMVNDQGLYEDVYVQVSGNEPGVLGNFLVYVKVADIYVNTTLESIVDSDNTTLKDLLAGNSEYFNKVFDGTQEYKGDNLKIDLAKTSGIKVVYTPMYSASAPEIELSEIKLVLEYERASIGATNIRIWAVLEGESDYKYDVWFADINDTDTATAIHKIAANITKLQVTVNIADYIETSYLYGDDIPTFIEAQITEEYTARVDLQTQAKKGAPVGNYNVLGKLHEANESIDITINKTSIDIVPRPVFVDVKFDGRDLPSKWNFDGEEHTLTATYKDVITGKDKQGKIEFYLGDERVPTSGFIGIGKYYLDIKTNDNNYTVDGLSTYVLEMVKGFLDINTGIAKVEYSGKNNEFPLDLTEEQKKFIKEGDITIEYYRYNDGAYFDEKTQSMVGTFDRTQPVTNRTDRGFYYVVINVNDTEYFYPQKYEGSLLIVNTAATTIEWDGEVSYSYDNLKHTFDLAEGKVKVTANDKKTVLWESSQPAEGKIVVKYYNKDTKTYEPIDTSDEKAFGWFMEVGEYSFRIEYLGDGQYIGEDYIEGNYARASLDVKLVITKAEFENVKFNSMTGTYDRTNFMDKFKASVVIPEEYLKTADIKYYYNGKGYSSLDGIICVNANTYNITLRMSKDNYEPLNVDATITVNPAKIDNVTVAPLVSTYIDSDDAEAKKQYLEFTGLERKDGKYYYMDHGAEVEALIVGTVYVVDAGAYAGTVTIYISNYEPLSLDTYIEIYPAEIKAQKASIDLPDRLPTGVPVTKYKGTYTTESGDQKTGKLLFYTKNEQTGELGLIEPDEEGVLPDGVYTVRIEVDRNHFIDQVWELKVGRINDKGLNTTAIIAISVTSGIMLLAIITAIVTVNKRKKRGRV